MKSLQDKYVSKSNLIAFSNPQNKELSKEFTSVLDTLINNWTSTNIYTISLTYNDPNSVLINTATSTNSGVTQNIYLENYIKDTINPSIKDLGILTLDRNANPNKLTFTPKVGSTSATTATTFSVSGLTSSSPSSTQGASIDSSVAGIARELEGKGMYQQAGSQAADAAKLKQDTLAALKKENDEKEGNLLNEEIIRMKKLMNL